jgi:hypothetical protein
MRVMVELFSGTAKMSEAFRNRGWTTYTFDNDPIHEPDFCMDILDVTPAMIRDLKPDVIWAGVDCSCFSPLTLGVYWNPDKTPNERNYGIDLLRHTVKLIEAGSPTFWAIENPVGMMRHQPEVKSWARYEIWQCQYGLDFAKPTDLFGYLPPSFYPKKCRRKGIGNDPDCPHVAAPAGSRTGIQNPDLSKIERASYPIELCRQISNHCHQSIMSGRTKGWFF